MRSWTPYRREVLATAGLTAFDGIPDVDLHHPFAPEPKGIWTFAPGTNAISGIVHEPRSETLYVGIGVGIFALDTADGSFVWDTTGDGVPVRPLSVVDRTLYAKADDSTIVAVDATTGEERWRTPWSAAVAPFRDTAFLVAGKLRARSSTTGKVRWTFEGEHRLSEMRPLVENETVYVTDTGGALYAVDADDGRERWRTNPVKRGQRINSKKIEPIAVIPDSPSASTGDSIIVWDKNRRELYVRSVSDGKPRWSFTVVSNPSHIGAIADDRFSVSIRRSLYTYSPSSNKPQWQASAPHPIVSEPRTDGERVYVGTEGGSVLAFDSKDGSKVWSFAGDTGSRMDIPDVRKGRLLAYDGEKLYLLSATDGSVRWIFDVNGGLTDPPLIADDAVFAGMANGHLVALGGPKSAPIGTAMRHVVGPAGVVGGLLGGALLVEGYRRYRSEEPELEPENDVDAIPTWNGYELRERFDDETHLARTTDGESVLLRRFHDPPENFERDAAAWAGLDFDGAQTVHDWGTDPDPWIAVERVKGRTLAEVGGSLDLDEIMSVIARTAEIVHRAHNDGVEHEKLTATNIVVGPEITVTNWRFTGSAEPSGMTADETVSRLGSIAESLIARNDADVSESLSDVLRRATTPNSDDHYKSALEFSDMLRWAVRDE